MSILKLVYCKLHILPVLLENNILFAHEVWPFTINTGVLWARQNVHGTVQGTVGD